MLHVQNCPSTGPMLPAHATDHIKAMSSLLGQRQRPNRFDIRSINQSINQSIDPSIGHLQLRPDPAADSPPGDWNLGFEAQAFFSLHVLTPCRAQMQPAVTMEGFRLGQVGTGHACSNQRSSRMYWLVIELLCLNSGAFFVTWA